MPQRLMAVAFPLLADVHGIGGAAAEMFLIERRSVCTVTVT